MRFDALAEVDLQDLVRLADLLEAGLLTLPMTALSLRDHMAAAHAASVAQWLEELSAEGMPPAHIALMLRAFAAGGKAAGISALSVEMVVSGPDATGGARDTGVVMRQLFAKASGGRAVATVDAARLMMLFPCASIPDRRIAQKKLRSGP